MTGASLFSWELERKILQGNMDVFNDNFGIPEREECRSVDEVYGNQTFLEIQSTKPFLNNWKTILRVNKQNPRFITNEYVDALYSSVFVSRNVRNNPATVQSTNKAAKWFCCVL